METYTVNFLNQTNETWTMAVYQTLPESAGLVSVSWKQTTVPPQGVSGVEWGIKYLACLADYKQIGGKGVYKSSQMLPTDLGVSWKCVFEENVQQLQQVGKTTSGQLLISNQSLKLANLGIGMDGNMALVKKDVYSGNEAQFIVKPSYFVALFKDLTQGQVISGNQIHGPLPINFSGGRTELNFVAKIEGQTFWFGELDNNTNQSLVRLEEMSERINRLSVDNH